MEQQALVSAKKIVRYQGDHAVTEEDLVVVELPLEIRLGFGPAHERVQRSISVTMRTPGHDLELALGFLYTEGVVKSLDEIAYIEHCTQVKSPDEFGHVVKAELKSGIEVDLAALSRNFYTSSSCGVCGKASLDAVEVQGCQVMPWDGTFLSPACLNTLPEKVRAAQVLYRHTGGNHAAALFSRDGELILLREDVGRHNAVDKVVGAMLSESGLESAGKLLFLSGRAGFELVQKAAMAGISIVAAVGAPSSLAVELAEKFNITLLGYLRDGRFNVYSVPERIRA